MRTTIASAAFLLLGAGAATIGAKSNLNNMLGSDTLFDLTRGVLTGIPATGSLPAVAACTGTAGLTYNGTGSGNGATQMRSGAQEAAPMSSTLSAAQACTGLAAPLPTAGQESEGIVIALDGLSIAVRPGNAPDATCGGVAFNGAGGAQLTPATCTEAGCSGGKYTPADERDYLRVLYFGVHGGAGTTARNCNSDVRKALIASYKNLFQNQATCTGGTCAGKKLKHAYRRDDASGTTDVFAAVIGIPGIYGGYNKKSYASGTGQQSNGYCNAGDVGSDHVTKGINLGFDESLSPLTGPNWNVLVGDSDFADLDPIRVPCEDGDEVCQADRTNGLVQVIFPFTELHPQMNYPVDFCDAGSVDLEIGAGPYVGYFGKCGDGSPAIVGGCVIGYKSCSPGTPCNQPGGSPKTTGRSYLCTQQAFPGLQGLCWLNAPQNGEECRGANNWVRNIDGSLVNDTSLGTSRQIFGAFFRKHMNSPGTGGSGTCRNTSATAQIGCLVGSAEPCSVGYAGREATDGQGAPADGVSVKGIAPTKANIQKLVSTVDSDFATRYPLSRKLYYNTIVGFGSSFNTTNDATGNGVSGEELTLGRCLADTTKYSPYYEARYGFIALPNGSFCEDFVEFRRCTGGVRPGSKCTADADCPGLASAGISAGTCPATPACAGATSENNACANNPTGIPL